MPPRKKRAAGSASTTSKPRRSTRRTVSNRGKSSSNIISNVYQEMLAEAAADSPEDFAPSARPVKRRKVSVDHSSNVDDLFESPPPATSEAAVTANEVGASARPQQIVFDDFEGSDDSDVEFEDVELEPEPQTVSVAETAQSEPLELDLSKSVLETPKRMLQRRKPISKAERVMRLDVHKWHLLSLLSHGLHRNSWCNSDTVHRVLKPTVPRQVIKLLHVDESKPLYERNYSFNKGVEEICLLWRQQWKTIVPGIRRAHWREDVDAQMEAEEGEDLDFDDFKTAAHTYSGSRDLGAQLFTALLRSIAVEARLVFSLQVLPITGAAKTDTPTKPRTNPQYVRAPAQNYGAATTHTSPFVPPATRQKKSKKIVDSPYPIFWTEILAPNQTWVPLDPIVRSTIAKPKTQFEPPLSDNLNGMTYVIAYEDDDSARDVTRRYTQWFNAKTRRLRVESTKNGEQWYTSAMSILQKKLREPRDEIEDDELARRANSEGMPNNIQDFKSHPVYVLERHMRANEVLQPKREVGKVNVGTTKNGKIESVYRRQDVHFCRTADAWYRRGRDVKVGEQPLKLAIPKSRGGLRAASAELSDDENDAENDGVGLYAEYQTNVYEPPPVVGGKIPRNAYGNLDVYVPSMVPSGAVHVSHPMAASAARAVGVDFADAVTGFEFKGRQGTAVVNGIVVAQQFTAAIATTIHAMEQLGSEEVQQARSRILLGTWKRMLQALRVRERVETEYGTGKRSAPRQVDGKSDTDDSAYEEDEGEEQDNDAGGGFMLEADATEEKVQEQKVNLQIMKEKMPAVLPDEVISVPIKLTRSPHKQPVVISQEQSRDANYRNDELFEGDGEDFIMGDGGFVPDDHEDTEAVGGGFVPEDGAEDDGDGGGGFFAGDEDGADAGGGFIQEDATSPSGHRTHDVVSSLSKHVANNTHGSEANVKVEVDVDVDALHSDIEEDSALQAAIAESLAKRTTPHAHRAEIEVQGSSAQPEPAEPSSSQQVSTEPNVAAAGGNGSPFNNDATAKDTKANDKKKRDEKATKLTATSAAVAAATVQVSETNSPTTSLMSHDPNEDDEEPDWVHDALD